MGPVPLSDYVLVLTLDLYEESGLGTCVDYPTRLPISNRDENCGWSLGTNQQTGALAEIAEIADGGGDYENVEILIVAMHHPIGGFDEVGHPYSRGSLCEVDTHCSGAPATECAADSDCTGDDVCGVPNCNDEFAHPRMQELHAAMAAMVARTSGIAIVLMGHDHNMSLGEKASSGVYYLHVGQLGGQELYPWGAHPSFEARYDFDGDTIPAYRRHLGKLGATATDWYSPWTDQNPPIEMGSEHKGFVILNLLPAAESGSAKTELLLDYIVNGRGYPRVHGASARGFPVLITGD
jgi:hypothetical protein